jgi:hypothetical protein
VKNKKLIARVFVAVVVGVMLLFVTLNPAPVRPLPPLPEEVRPLFDELVKDEPANRERAKDDWAHHRWSQQDAFGAMELERVNTVAREKQRSAQDLFLVIDDGVRAKWPAPGADGGVLQATIVPLKPRPLD